MAALNFRPQKRGEGLVTRTAEEGKLSPTAGLSDSRSRGRGEVVPSAAYGFGTRKRGRGEFFAKMTCAACNPRLERKTNFRREKRRRFDWQMNPLGDSITEDRRGKVFFPLIPANRGASGDPAPFLRCSKRRGPTARIVEEGRRLRIAAGAPRQTLLERGRQLFDQCRERGEESVR